MPIEDVRAEVSIGEESRGEQSGEEERSGGKWRGAYNDPHETHLSWRASFSDVSASMPIGGCESRSEQR
jgi:hypothetical protein